MGCVSGHRRSHVGTPDRIAVRAKDPAENIARRPGNCPRRATRGGGCLRPAAIAGDWLTVYPACSRAASCRKPGRWELVPAPSGSHVRRGGVDWSAAFTVVRLAAGAAREASRPVATSPAPCGRSVRPRHRLGSALLVVAGACHQARTWRDRWPGRAASTDLVSGAGLRAGDLSRVGDMRATVGRGADASAYPLDAIV